MFFGKSKLTSGLLATVICFFSVIICNAVGDEKPFFMEVLTEKARLITVLRNYAAEKRVVKGLMDMVFSEIGSEQKEWLKCCFPGEDPKSGHPELYYLWLAKEFDKLSDIDIENEEFRLHIVPQINAFEERLLERVQKICPGVYYYYAVIPMSVYDLATILVKSPDLYPGGPLPQ